MRAPPPRWAAPHCWAGQRLWPPGSATGGSPRTARLEEPVLVNKASRGSVTSRTLLGRRIPTLRRRHVHRHPPPPGTPPRHGAWPPLGRPAAVRPARTRRCGRSIQTGRIRKAQHQRRGVEADDKAAGLAVAVDYGLADLVPAAGHGWPARAQRLPEGCAVSAGRRRCGGRRPVRSAGRTLGQAGSTSEPRHSGPGTPSG